MNVRVGIGAWEASTQVELIACPHVGDQIEVKGETVLCERVLIGRNGVWVYEVRHFPTPEDAEALKTRWAQHPTKA